MNARATWKGSLHVSLLSVRVKAYASHTRQQQTVQLHQLHGDCRQRIRYQKVCPVHGPVESDQIVMGYEHAPDQHVQIDLKELDQLRSQHELRSIRIATFFATGKVPPLYFGEKHYYLLPDGPMAQVAYALLVRAMLSRKAEAVAQVVLSKREQLVLLRIVEGKLLVMTCLKYADQVRVPTAFTEELAAVPAVADGELELAKTLVAQQTATDFDLAQFKDEYDMKLTQLVDAKVQGLDLPAATDDQPAQIFSLIEALQASVEQAATEPTDKTPQKQKAVKKTSRRKRSTAKSTRRRKQSVAKTA